MQKQWWLFALIIVLVAVVLFQDNDDMRAMLSPDGKADVNEKSSALESIGLKDDGQPLLVPQCLDGADNDGDGKVDYPIDCGCATESDNDETGDCPVPPSVAPSGIDQERLPDVIMEDISVLVISVNRSESPPFYELRFNATYRNIGNDYTRIVSHEFGLYGSDGIIFRTGGTGYLPPPGLAPGGYGPLTGFFGGYLLPGTYVLSATADPDDLIEELDEENNQNNRTFILD